MKTKPFENNASAVPSKERVHLFVCSPTASGVGGLEEHPRTPGEPITARYVGLMENVALALRHASSVPPGAVALVIPEFFSVPTQLDKRVLTKRYGTSDRTIENWLTKHLIVGGRKGRALQFEPLDCDRRLFAHTATQAPSPIREGPFMQSINSEDKIFATMAYLAQRYDVDIRTIKTWKKMGLLTYFQVRRVLRFDVAACDASLRQHGFLE